MADNIAITAGEGTAVAADDVGSVFFQKIKLDLGTDGATAPALAGAGVVATGVQRITLASDDPAVTHLNNILTAVQIMDDWDDGDKCKVILQTGANAIGKLAANTGVDIGDVDVTSIVPGSAATNLGKARDVACGANDVGVMALAVRDDALTTLTPVDGDYVPLRVSSTGALHVTGGGGGTEYTEDVASANPIVGSAVMMERDDALGGLTPAEGDWASLRCDANGALWTHDDALDAVIDGAFLNVNLNMAGTDAAAGEGVIDAQTQRVTIATDDDGVAHLATIAGDTTNIETAVQLLDNAVYVDDADWTDNTSSHLLVGGIYQSTPHTVTDGDVSPFQLDANGKIMVSGVTACNTGAVVLSSGTVTTVSTVTNLSQLGGVAINMGEGAIDTGTQRVTLATDDDGVAHLATIAGAVSTQMQCDVVAALPAGDNNIGNVDIVTVPAPLNVVGGGTEAAALRVTLANDSTGVITVDGTVTADLSATDNAVLDSIVTNTAREVITGAGQAKLDHADVTTAQVLVAAVADKKFYITSMILSVAAAGSYWVEDDDAAQITCKYTLAANGGVVISFPIDTPYKSTTANKGLKVKGSAAGVIGCMITYYTLA